MQAGGPKLAIQTVNDLLGSQLQVNHVVVVDFGSFVKLIDAVGGIDVNVPENILSNRFDCPYPTQARCDQWQGWKFHKGMTHMDGHKALIYSRIRENRLNPADSDFSRGQHQQQVMQATLSKLASASTFFRLPFDGSSLMAPLSTDLSTWDLMQLGWVKFRAGSTIHCRLGGTGYRQRLHHGRRGEHPGDPGGARQLGAATAAGRQPLRSRLRGREPAVQVASSSWRRATTRSSGGCARRRGRSASSLPSRRRISRRCGCTRTASPTRDVEALLASGLSEDEVFEATVAAAVGGRAGAVRRRAEDAGMRLRCVESGHDPEQTAVLEGIRVERDASRWTSSRRCTTGRRCSGGRSATRSTSMRGESDWTPGERELFAAYVSSLNQCPF